MAEQKEFKDIRVLAQQRVDDHYKLMSEDYNFGFITEQLKPIQLCSIKAMLCCKQLEGLEDCLLDIMRNSEAYSFLGCE